MASLVMGLGHPVLDGRNAAGPVVEEGGEVLAALSEVVARDVALGAGDGVVEFIGGGCWAASSRVRTSLRCRAASPSGASVDARRLVHERRIPFVKWGHLLRFDPTEIEAWIDQIRRPLG